MDRVPFKKLAILKKKLYFADIILKKNSEVLKNPSVVNWQKQAMFLIAARNMDAIINQMIATPAIIFRADGKVDKRRHRRYITKHKKLKKLYPNMGKLK